MSIDENKEVIRDFFTALSNGKSEQAREPLHENVAWTILNARSRDENLQINTR